MIVADTNLLAYLHITGVHTAHVEAVLARDPSWIAPLLWRSELRSTLMAFIRAEKLSFEAALDVMAAAERRMLGHEYGVGSREVLELARRSRCSAFDCEYVSLAQHFDVKLVTTDREVLVAFPETAVSPETFVS